MRYYIIAGERSGDLHGSNLIKSLLHYDPKAVVRGFGGDEMKLAGADIVVHFEEMAFMGFVRLITNYGTIRRMLKFCKEDIIRFKPDAVILIDYGGFNRRIAAFTKPRSIKTFYYIPPKIWAWYQSRAKEIKANVDRLFVILPFEKEFYKKYDWEVDYVGNPVLDAVKAFKPDPDFRTNYNLTDDKPVIALLPGSRRMELQKIIPLMSELVNRHPAYQFVVAALPDLDPALYQPLQGKANVSFIQDDTYNLLHVARAAVVTSGTATLETALFKVPQVCVYKAGWLEYRIAKMLVKVEWVSLVNLIGNKAVISELIQNDATVPGVSGELVNLVNEGSRRAGMLQDYDKIYRILDTGSASDNAGRLMVSYLKP
ncbi:MAG TPA: lipid-A-disaccharide synthase [Cyclobacteriaceae bacterium]|nr:lipid-A-disaccharide synthase [Cyclobacteriaceae bacterium]